MSTDNDELNKLLEDIQRIEKFQPNCADYRNWIEYNKACFKKWDD